MESKKNLQTSLWSVFYIATILLFSTVVWGNEANKTEQKDVPEITNELSLLEISQILSNLKSEIEETKNELRIIKESNVQTNKRLDLLQETLIRKADLSWTNFFKDYGPFLIALIALGFTWWQLYATRNHNELSVRPDITVRYSFGSESVGIILENNGLGPGVIKSLSLERGGVKTLINHPVELIDYFINLHMPSPSIEFPFSGNSLSPGKKYNLVVFHADNSSPKRDFVERCVMEVKVTVKYGDYYGNEWPH